MFEYEERTIVSCPLCSVLIYLAPARSPDRDCYSRRHAVRGDYDYTSLRHLRSHFGIGTL
jgi:hypothetical protein